MLLKYQIRLIMLAIVNLMNVANSLNYGSECRSNQCNQDRGYIEYRGPTLETTWNIRSQNRQFTTFVLHLKNIMNSNSKQTWLQIRQGYYTYQREILIKGSQEQIFVFESTDEVTISMQRFDIAIRFRLEFFVGCGILEGDKLNIKRVALQSDLQASTISAQFNYAEVPSSTYTQPKHTCWLVVPTIKKLETILTPQQQLQQQIYATWGLAYPLPPPTTRYVESEETHMMLDPISLSSNTILEISDLLSGNSLLSVGSGGVKEFKILNKSSTMVEYKSSRNISTLIFVEEICEDGQICEQNTFLFNANALQTSDLDCMERERKCLFRIENEAYNCSQPTGLSVLEHLRSSICPAFNSILENNFSEMQQSNDVDFEPELIGKNLNINARSILTKCKHHRIYCISNSCKPFARNKCQLVCEMLKSWKICSYFVLGSGIFD